MSPVDVSAAGTHTLAVVCHQLDPAAEGSWQVPFARVTAEQVSRLN